MRGFKIFISKDGTGYIKRKCPFGISRRSYNHPNAKCSPPTILKWCKGALRFETNNTDFTTVSLVLFEHADESFKLC